MLKKSVIVFTLVLVAFSAAPQVWGNQPHWDDGYRIFQDHSPNFVHVEILNVDVTSNKALWFASASDKVEIEARILKVVRTADNLQPGMIIPILYNRKAAAGGTYAETPGIPERGAVVPAFIKRKGDHFIPAARHHTFAPLAEQQLKKLDRENVELTEAQIAAFKLPEGINTSLRLDEGSKLPLVDAETATTPKAAPPTAESTTPQEVSPEMITTHPSSEAPGMITPVIPESETALTETSPQIPVLRAERVETASAATDSTPSITMRSEVQPPTTISDTMNSDRPKRRTVVVVPPSELRARRQQEARVISNVQESTSSSPSIPLVQTVPDTNEPVNNESAADAELVTEATVPITNIENATQDPVETTLAEAEKMVQPANTVPDYPVLRAEPVAETGASPAEKTPSVADTVDAPDTQTIAPSTPSTSVEPITITDFAPELPRPPQTQKTAPATSATDLTASDRSNMRIYADIYMDLQKAGEAASQQNYSKAKNLYQKALNELQALKSAHPDFQPFMVEYRIRDTSRKLEQLIVTTPKE